MKKTLILLAGYPATGKSYLCSQICSKHPEFRILSQDELKEGLWDQYGFDNMEEKTVLEMNSIMRKWIRRWKRENRLFPIIPSAKSKREGFVHWQKKTVIRSLRFGLWGILIHCIKDPEEEIWLRTGIWDILYAAITREILWRTEAEQTVWLHRKFSGTGA